jgi:hypothetical protein
VYLLKGFVNDEVAGSSWLLRDTTNEVLASVVFLFSKHPFDIEDQVIIKGKKYKVVEVRLLSTVFHDGDSVQVQAPNSLLNTLVGCVPETDHPSLIHFSSSFTIFGGALLLVYLLIYPSRLTFCGRLQSLSLSKSATSRLRINWTTLENL